MLAVLGVMILVGAVWWVLPQPDKRFVSQSSTTIDPGPKLDGRLAAASAGSEVEQAGEPAPTGPPMTFDTVNAANARELEQPYLVVLATRRSTDELQKEFLTYRATYPTLLGSSKARVDRVQGQDRQTWYRLSVIPPQARDDAKALCSNLRAAGLTGCWIKPVPLN
jgi:cell division protein FtsN